MVVNNKTKFRSVTEEEIFMIEDKKNFGRFTVRRVNMEEWEILQGRVIVLPSTRESNVSKFLNRQKLSN